MEGVLKERHSRMRRVRKPNIERTKAGVALARERQVRFGRPPKLTPALIKQVTLAHESQGTTIVETCRLLGISKSSYYAALRASRQDQPDLAA